VIETRLKYCLFDPDPNGNDRYYVRKRGHRKIRIWETFQDSDGRITAAFMKAYFEALETLDGKPATPPKTPREKSFYWLVDQYYRSSKFKNFDPLTQADCQSAFKSDPVSASNFDPFERRGFAVALASSELAGIAETWRARAT
jgi:hypothetical protein